MFGNYLDDSEEDYASVGDIVSPNRVSDIVDRVGGRFSGRILCSKANNSFVSIATFIAPHIILTARHVLNGFMCSDLVFSYQNATVSVSLLEDGAQFCLDYVLLYTPHSFGSGVVPISTNLPNEGSLFGCYKQNDTRIVKVLQRPCQQILDFESTLDVIRGYSGAPYINQKGQIFGLHLSGYQEHSMWAGRVTGITFGQLLANPNQRAYIQRILREENIQTYSMIPNLRPRNYFFDDDFILTWPSIGQIGHAARDSALGATPQLGSATATQVLLRYFLKRDKLIRTYKAEVIPDRFNGNDMLFLNQLRAGAKDVLIGNYYSRIGTAGVTVFPDDEEKRLFRLLARTNDWKILIKMPQGGDLDNTQHEWHPLSIKKRPLSNIAGVQMGHKMGAVDYWAYGAGTRNTPLPPNWGWLKDERIPQIERAKAAYRNPADLSQKKTTLEQKYANYIAPGYSVHPNHNQFMLNHMNYHFQWWEINQRDGRIAGQITRYKDYTPAGYRWNGNKLE